VCQRSSSYLLAINNEEELIQSFCFQMVIIMNYYLITEDAMYGTQADWLRIHFLNIWETQSVMSKNEANLEENMLRIGEREPSDSIF
jgi:hypothetical protein